MRKRTAVAIALGAIVVLTSAHAQMTTVSFGLLAASGTPREIQAAIDDGADVDARGYRNMTALMWAAMVNPNPKVIHTLIAAGADIKAQDEHGTTALMHAAASTHNPAVITALLKAGGRQRSRLPRRDPANVRRRVHS